MRALSERTPDNEPRLSRGRLWLLALASLLAPSVMMIQYLRDLAGDLPVLIGASRKRFLGTLLPGPDGEPRPPSGRETEPISAPRKPSPAR